VALNLRRGLAKERKDEAKKETIADPYNLKHKTVCITGTVRGLTRLQAQKKLKQRYTTIKFTSSITSQTQILITGYGVGQKKLTVATTRKLPIIEWIKIWVN